MTDRARAVALSCLLLACPRRPPPPDASPPAERHDAATPTDAPADVPVVTDALTVDVSVRHPPRPALASAWRRMPRVVVSSARSLATWDEAPDLDGDDIPDPFDALAWDPRTLTCVPGDDDHPCPSSDPDDSGGNANDGPLEVGYVVFLSGEATADGGRIGRLVGTRRLWQAASDVPATHLASIEFAEFGPGVLIRSTLASRQAQSEDTLDVVDLFMGAGLDRHAGSMLHHCTRRGGQGALRSGAIAVSAGSLAPLVWRAAQAHPFSGCATSAESFDASLGDSLARGAAVTLLSTAPAGTRAHVSIGFVDNSLQLVAPVGATVMDGSARVDPLTLGDTTVQEVLRGCATDRVRYTLDGHHCELQVPRDDGALPGCEDHNSPLDPRPPRAVSLLPGAEGGTRLLFTRGGSALSFPMPARCGHAGGHLEATPWHGGLPAGLSVSPEGSRVLAANGFDLWLHVPGRRAPILLNPPGGTLPRGTVRAMAFADAGRAAAVIAEDFVVFDITLTDDDGGPSELRVDPSELARPFHGI